MKKSIITTALLAVASGAVSAQSNVVFYGVLDLGVSVDGGATSQSASSASQVRVTSGMATQSRWGFRGTEDLGGGLAAFFVIEGGIHADTGTSTQNNTIFGRNTAVGLRGNFGALSIGVQDTPLFTTLNTVVDPLRNGIIRSNNLMSPTGFRTGNSVLWRSRDYAGFSADAMVAPGEVAADSTAARAIGGSFGYARGPLTARIAYHQKNNDTATLKNTEAARNTLLGANYDFGPIKAFFGYEINRGPNSSPLNNTLPVFGGAAPVASTDSRDLLLAASMPFGASTVVVSYGHKNDRSRFDQDAQQLGAAYMYAFSKRSDIYTSFARIRNHNGAAYTEGNSEEAGTGNRQFTLGLRHRF